MKCYKHNTYTTIVEITKEEVSKINFDICKQPRETIDAYYKRQTIKPDIICNAGFFNMKDGSTIFSVINEKMVCSTHQDIKLGIGIVGDKDVQFGSVNDKQWRDFMSGYPPLIVDGKEYETWIGSELNYKARRTVFGYNATHFYVICVDNPGMNYKQLKELCLKLKLTHAINLDGGGSTRLLVNGIRKTITTANRAVDSVLCVYLNKELEAKVEENITVKKEPDASILPPPTTTNNIKYIARINCSALNVRKGAGIHFPVCDCIKDKNKDLNIISECNGWAKMQTGWVNMNYIKKVVTTTTTATIKYTGVITASSSLNIRNTPDTNSSIMGSYKKNEKIEVLEEKDGWGKTQLGWVSLKYVAKI